MAKHVEKVFSGLEKKKPANDHVPDFMLTLRKVLRWFAGIWALCALAVLISGLVEIVRDYSSPNGWYYVSGFMFLLFLAWSLWHVSDRLIAWYTARLAQAAKDPAQKIQTQRVVTRQAAITHIEIKDKNPEDVFWVETRRGRVVFDSTQRPTRLLFAGAFLIIGLIIGASIFSFSNDIGFFEYAFVGGWIIFCLVAMGFVYEVAIDKRAGTAEQKKGWFVFVIKRTFRLKDFTRIVVESTFYRQRHSSARNRHQSQDPVFSVNLTGKKELNLRVFAHLSDARRMAEDLSVYLKLPLEEKTEARI